MGTMVESLSLQVVQYPHPTLRHVSRPLKRVDAELKSMIGNMFELMYEHKGIGLAANQVDLPYRVFVGNVTGDPEAKSEEHVFINPVVRSRKGSEEAEEGCLSLPGVHGMVTRPERIVLNAYRLDGTEIEWPLEGLFARMVQHEIDHLDGVLFVDRLSTTGKLEIKNAIQDFEIVYEGQRRRGEIPTEERIQSRLAELERLRT
jgi:peptide deformylase